MPLLTDVGAYLETSSVAVVMTTWLGQTGTFIFEAQMPADCNTGLCLNEYGSAEPEFVLIDTGVHIEVPHFQVYCRHTDYATGRALIEAAYQALAKVINQTLGSTKYLRIEPIQSPFSLDPPQDAQGRWEWFCNFRTEKALG